MSEHRQDVVRDANDKLATAMITKELQNTLAPRVYEECSLAYGATVSAGDRLTATCSKLGFVSLWESTSGRLLWQNAVLAPRNHNAFDHPVLPSFSPDGRYLAVFNAPNSISVIDTSSDITEMHYMVQYANVEFANTVAIAIHQPDIVPSSPSIPEHFYFPVDLIRGCKHQRVYVPARVDGQTGTYRERRLGYLADGMVLFVVAVLLWNPCIK